MGFRDLFASLSAGFQKHTAVAAAGTRDCEPFDVYVAARPFTDFGGALLRRLSPDAKAMMVELGVCHYMTILRCPATGTLTQFDFGPIGGDIHVPLAASTHMQQEDTAQSAPANQQPSRSRRRCSKSVPGETRIRQLDALPDIHMHVGTTTLSVGEIAEWSQSFGTTYHLNISDCRHYTNQLVRRTTGMDSAAAHLVRHHHTTRRQHSPHLFDHVLPAIQTVTNVDNWPAVQLSAYVTGVAAVAAVSQPIAHPVASAVVAMTVLSRQHAATAIQRMAQLKPALVRVRSTRAAALSGASAVVPYSTAAVHKLKHGFASCTHSIVGISSSALRKVTQRGSGQTPRALPQTIHASGVACAASAAAKLRPVQAGMAQAASRAPATMSAAVNTMRMAVSAQKGHVPKLLRAAGALRPMNLVR